MIFSILKAFNNFVLMFPRLLDNSESLERSSRKLDQGQELLTETEAIGASVLNDLEHQKEVLFRSRNRVWPRAKYFYNY